jgi:hypothetical protein
LPQRAVKYRVAGGVGEVRKDDGVFVRQRVYLVRKKHPADDGQSDSYDQCCDGSDRPPPSGFRACFQRLRIAAQYIVALLPAFQGRGSLNGLHPAYFRTEESISSPRNCLNVSGIFGVIVQRFSELANRHPEAAVEVNKRIPRPETALKFLPADNFAGAFHECNEEPAGLLLQLDVSPVFKEFPRGDVYLKRTELINNSGLCLHTWAPQAVED